MRPDLVFTAGCAVHDEANPLPGIVEIDRPKDTSMKCIKVQITEIVLVDVRSIVLCRQRLRHESRRSNLQCAGRPLTSESKISNQGFTSCYAISSLI